MEIQAPKKEKKFLKSIGRIAGVLAQELVLGLGRKYIGKMINKIKIPKKRETLSFLLLLSCTFAFAQYPVTGNKQRLGYQTTGDGLVWRGRANDTVSLKSSTINNAYIIIDTVNNVMCNYIKTKGGWLFNNADTVIINNNFTQPVDSLFFKTSVPTNNVDTAKMRWDSDLGTVVLGMYDKVPNELGFKNFWLVKNQTGSTITKGSLVYASGTVGSSGRISVSKFIANGTIEPIYLLGITAHDLTDGEDGYVISYGKIRQVNTDTFAAGAILYPSPTTAGVWTDVEPVAPNIDLPIGFCVNSSSNNGTIAIRVASGFSLSELHDVAISSPSANASLYYSGGLWRDTTAALLVSDTASMLTNYLRSGVAASTYLPLTGGTTSGLITSSFLNTSNYSTSATDNNAFIIYNTTQSTNNIYGGIQFLIGENSGLIPGGPGLAQIYAIRAGGTSNPSTDLTFITKSSVSGILEKMRIKFDGKVGIGTSTPSYLLDVNGQIGSTGFIKSGGTSSQFLKADGSVDASTYLTSSTGVTTFSAGTTGFTPSSATSGAVTLAGTLAIANGGTGATSASAARTALGATVRGANTFTLTDIGAISFLRYNADNTVSQRAADGMRSDLGGTTIGQSMFTLTNPSAITFPRFNADNTVSALSATDFRTAIGAGTGNGNGTVTSVTAGSPANGLSVASTTTTPVISMALAGSATTGVVSATTQTFGGAKTFAGDINGSSALNVTGFSTLTGGASIGTMATTSSLTHVLGVNSSNAIGEIGVSDGIKFTSGFLGLDSYKTIAIMDFPSTSAQSSSDLTATVTGAVAGTPVLLGVPNASVVANTSYSAWVSSTNTVTVRFNNYSSSSANPASGSFYLIVLNL